jgi:hypothetical protein
MWYTLSRLTRPAAMGTAVVGVAALAGLAGPSPAGADEAHARELLRAMSDYLGAQKALAFDFDISVEVITVEDQRLAIASSGAVTLQRPDRVRARRTGGFADVEMVFDGDTMTVLGKNANVYGQIKAPGSVDQLIEVLRDEYGLPLPTADLLLSDFYGEVMPLVVDVKDLAAGVIGGVECDHLALRTEEVDFQIWIARGDQPYPCRYMIATKTIIGWPQYTVDVRGWKAGDDVAADDFTLSLPADALMLSDDELHVLGELPSLFVWE